MKFDYDIYINFSFRDNIAENETSRQWVSSFKKFLDTVLVQLMGYQPTYLQYSNNEKPSASELQKAAVMVCVISPDFIASSGCIEDIEEFFKGNQSVTIPGIELKDRILKVVKFPVKTEMLPSRLRQFLNYDLFNQDFTTDSVSEYSEFFSDGDGKKFWLKVVDLAYDITYVLRAIREEKALTDTTRQCVYLAETGKDLVNERDIIKRELIRHGYKVFPDKSLPVNIRELEVTIKKDLEKCCLSIHLIGNDYGEIPLGAEVSIIELQNKLASEYNVMTEDANNEIDNFSRLVWVKPDARFLTERQKIFTENLQRDLEVNSGVEVLECPLEDFKTVVLHTLVIPLIAKPMELFSEGHNNKPSVYLIYDKADAGASKWISDTLLSYDIQVKKPVYSGSLMEQRNIHLDNLKNCDGAIIFCDKASERWVNVKCMDLLKAPGLGRKKDRFEKGLITEKVPETSQNWLQHKNIRLLEKSGKNSLENFIASIKK